MENKLVPAILMLAISVGSVGLVIWAINKGLARINYSQQQRRRILKLAMLGVGAWLILLAVLAGAGVFKIFSMPPRVPFTVILPVVAILIGSFTGKCKSLLRAIPPHWIMIMQAFRVPVELWLWFAFAKGLMPVQMTFEGRNYDMISGVLGLVAGWMIMGKRKGWKLISVVYNIIGLALLLNIVMVAVLSFPGPTRYFMNEPANVIMSEFPFIYLPGVLVVLAFALHIFSLRQLVIVEK